MAGTGETITYGELEARTNRLAHLLRAEGLGRLDHYAIYMENNARYVECCGAGERAGLYYTCVNSFLTPDELAYVVNNSQSKVLITSQAKREVALAALAQCPAVRLCLIVDGAAVTPARYTVVPPVTLIAGAYGIHMLGAMSQGRRHVVSGARSQDQHPPVGGQVRTCTAILIGFVIEER